MTAKIKLDNELLKIDPNYIVKKLKILLQPLLSSLIVKES